MFVELPETVAPEKVTDCPTVRWLGVIANRRVVLAGALVGVARRPEVGPVDWTVAAIPRSVVGELAPHALTAAANRTARATDRELRFTRELSGRDDELSIAVPVARFPRDYVAG
jgi:hypothetical protein